MLCGGEYDASDPDMEGPFPTMEERLIRAKQLWDDDTNGVLILLLADVNPQGELNVRGYDPAREQA